MAYPNRLYFGDCLDVMRQDIADESIDLIYLDPRSTRSGSTTPSSAALSGLRSMTPGAGMKPSMTFMPWPERREPWRIPWRACGGFSARERNSPPCHTWPTRLRECHRVLKPTGSIYLHCDPTEPLAKFLSPGSGEAGSVGCFRSPLHLEVGIHGFAVSHQR